MTAIVSVSHNAASVERALREFTSHVQKVLIRRTLNEGADRKARPLAVKAAQERGQWDSAKYVRDKSSVVFASNDNLEATVKFSQSKYSTIRNFGFSNVAGVGLRAKPWGKSRMYKGAFILNVNGGIPVVPNKRTKKWGTQRGLSGIYGPSVPREVERDIEESPAILNETGRYMVDRLGHHIHQAQNTAKSRYRV